LAFVFYKFKALGICRENKCKKNAVVQTANKKMTLMISLRFLKESENMDIPHGRSKTKNIFTYTTNNNLQPICYISQKKRVAFTTLLFSN
jgi:hypothetical protein